MDFLDHNDPRQRLLYNDEPKDWNPVKEPIPLSMRANTKDIYLADDDTKYGPPGNRKPGVVEYEARKMMERVGNGLLPGEINLAMGANQITDQYWKQCNNLSNPDAGEYCGKTKDSLLNDIEDIQNKTKKSSDVMKDIYEYWLKKKILK